MNRRKALKSIGISFGSITFSSSILSVLHSCQSNELDWSPDFFTKKQIVFIDRIFEIIIPETDTPGAISLNLSRFVDAYIYKNTPSEDQSELNNEIDELTDVILSNENQKSIDDVNNITLEKYLSNHLDSPDFIESNGNNYSQVFGLLRQMAVRSYKLTEYVMTNKLGYVPIPGYYDGNVDV
jgi:hypothetical protein